MLIVERRLSSSYSQSKQIKGSKMSYRASRVPWQVVAPLLRDIREKVFVC